MLLSIFAVITIYFGYSYHSGMSAISNNLQFKAKLSDYGIFKGKMSDLKPSNGIELFEISSPLFTDYAEKQRLIRIPEGKHLSATGNSLPEFPEGTLIAKTFFYSHAERNRKKMVETRLLILKNATWNAATYKWSDNQQDAFLINEGAVIPVNFVGNDGKIRQINYLIPTQKECGGCHRDYDRLTPIGPRLSNLNIEVSRNGKTINQLLYLNRNGLLDLGHQKKFDRLPDYRDTTLPNDLRARAYFSMNCAHCHRQGGIAGQTSLNLEYNTDFYHTGIQYHKQNIIERTAMMGAFHMPKLGTTIIDEQGVALIRKYIKTISQNANEK